MIAVAVYEKKKEKLAAKIATLKKRIEKDTDDLNKAQAEYSELCFMEIKAKENCDEKQLTDTLIQEHNLIQLLRGKGFTDEQLLALANGVDSSAESNSVSEKHGNDHRNPYAVSEELEGQMSFADN